MARYATFNDWQNEIENFSTRRERMLEDFPPEYADRLDKWVRVAWDLGFAAGREDQRKHPF